MELNKTHKIIWVLYCLLLFLPFAIEVFVIAPITMTNEPQHLWGAIHWVYCYISYGLVCILHYKWRKKTDCKITFFPEKHKFVWMLLAIIIGVGVRRTIHFIAGLGFGVPMLYNEFVFWMQLEPLWMGIGGFAMQYIYYIFEFVLIAFIVDCTQKTASRFSLSQKIPWGGIFLALTWGLVHPFGVLNFFRGESLFAVNMIILCLVIGYAYFLPGKKPVYAFLAGIAWYWL